MRDRDQSFGRFGIVPRRIFGPPALPAIADLAIDESAVLTWSKPAGSGAATKYIVYRDGVVLATLVDLATYTDETSTTNEHNYEVRTRHNGRISAASNRVVGPPAPPSIPQPIAIWNFASNLADEIDAVTLAATGGTPSYEAGPFGSESAVTTGGILANTNAKFSALAATPGVPFTISTWLKFTAAFLVADTGSYSGGLFLRVPGTTPNSWRIGLEGVFFYAGDTYLGVPPEWADEVVGPWGEGWNHLAIVYSGTAMSVYHNGMLLATRTLARAVAGSATDTIEMNNGGFALPRGQTAIFDSALSAEHIAALAVGVPYANPWIY